jgi:hypothetical protein
MKARITWLVKYEGFGTSAGLLNCQAGEKPAPFKNKNGGCLRSHRRQPPTNRQRNEAASDMAQKDILPTPEPEPGFDPDLNLTNEQILTIAAQCCGTVRTGYPHRRSYDKSQVAAAELWLFRYALAARVAKTRRDFIEIMSFLLYP